MVSRVGTSPQQAMTTSGSVPSSVDANDQIPSPLVQWSTACLPVEPVVLGLLPCHDHVDVVATPQAMVGHREQAVGVGRQVDACHRRLLGDDVVEKPGILMRKSIVILTPDMAGE